jgi:TorA maturation chaperone TorD
MAASQRLQERSDAAGGAELAPEEQARAETYLLLAHLLHGPPGAGLLDALGALEGDASAFGQTRAALARAARETAPPRVAAEYRKLFEGLPEAKLMPYGSHYLTGKLFGRPLAELRIAMARLGLAQSDDAREPEDHIASELEVMAGLILGSFSDAPASLWEQRGFFEAHLWTWMPAFFTDLERVAEGGFYARVGNCGRGFIEVEHKAFAMFGAEF